MQKLTSFSSFCKMRVIMTFCSITLLSAVIIIPTGSFLKIPIQWLLRFFCCIIDFTMPNFNSFASHENFNEKIASDRIDILLLRVISNTVRRNSLPGFLKMSLLKRDQVMKFRMRESTFVVVRNIST